MSNTLTNELPKKEQDIIKNILKKVTDMLDRSVITFKKIIDMLPNSLQKPIKNAWRIIRNLLEIFLKFYFALHYNLKRSLKKLKKPSEYNAYNLHLSEELHDFAFTLIPSTEEFNTKPFSILQSRIKKLKKYYDEKDYQTSFLYFQILDMPSIISGSWNAEISFSLNNASSFFRIGVELCIRVGLNAL